MIIPQFDSFPVFVFLWCFILTNYFYVCYVDLIFGTLSGEICSVDTSEGQSKITSLGHYGLDTTDTILGICWLKHDRNRFLVGSSKGRISCGSIDHSTASSTITKEYPKFGQQLTSIHINSSNQNMLISGYSNGASLYDLNTGVVTREYTDIHENHINISRFSNHSPDILATSSFDGTIKTWDLRVHTQTPLYTLKLSSGVVMINFSNDDVFLLASALDNEITQYLFLDGRKHLSYNIPKTGHGGNFSRTYCSSSGRHAVTGSCEETVVKVLCTFTGEVLANVDMYPGKRDSSLYVQVRVKIL